MNAQRITMPRRPRRGGSAPARRRVRGTVIVNAVVAMLLVLVVLIGTELGYLFYMKRELQKAADLSALAGTQILKPTNCATASDVASTNATKNLSFLRPSQFQFKATCGTWNPATLPGPKYFSSAASAGAINALHVEITGSTALLFPNIGGNSVRTLKVEAYAVKDTPLAVFSVGSKLVDINPAAPLISILKFVGVDPSGTCVACYTGLAGVKITPGGLLEKLGIPVAADISVADLNALLAASKVKLGDLLNAVVQLAGQDSLLGVNAQLIGSLVNAGLNLDSLQVQLGSNATAGGLFAAINAPTGSSALNVQLDAFDLIKTSLGVGTKDHAAQLGTGLNILGLAVSVEARVIEPPSIGIGGVETVAYNSQVRAFIQIQTKPGELLGALLGALGTQINLPISINVVNAFGTLKAINCDVTPYEATIQVEAPVLRACMGQIPSSILWSKADVCSTSNLGSMTFVKLLGIDLLKGSVSIPALNSVDSVTLPVGSTKTTDRNPLPLGDTVQDLVDKLLKLLFGSGTDNVDPAARAATPDIAAKLADYYLGKAGGSVSRLRSLMEQDNMTWSRPALLGLLSTNMPQEWEDKVNTPSLLGGCGGNLSSTCARNALIQSLQTRNQDGLITGLLKGLVDLVSGLLGLNPNSGGTPLLSAVLGPLIELLKPLLNSIGGLLSNLLGDTLGLELGRTDVHLQSVSCQNSRLVY